MNDSRFLYDYFECMNEMMRNQQSSMFEAEVGVSRESRQV